MFGSSNAAVVRPKTKRVTSRIDRLAIVNWSKAREMSSHASCSRRERRDSANWRHRVRKDCVVE